MSGYRDNPKPALHPDEDFARGVLKPALARGETLLWATRPKRGFIYEPHPNSFVNGIWTLFSLIWMCTGWLTSVSWTLSALGVPFVLMGLHGLIGHNLLDAWRRRNLVYGMTNRRLLIATSSRLVAAPWLGELRTHVVKRRDGVGHLRVVAPRLELRALANVDEVQRLLIEAQAVAPESAPVSSAAPSSAAPSSAAPSSAAPESASADSARAASSR